MREALPPFWGSGLCQIWAFQLGQATAAACCDPALLAEAGGADLVACQRLHALGVRSAAPVPARGKAACPSQSALRGVPLGPSLLGAGAGMFALARAAAAGSWHSGEAAVHLLLYGDGGR